MRMPTAMRPGAKAAREGRVRVPRTAFDLSKGRMQTFDGGLLVPVYWEDVVPGDTFRLKMRGFARIATLLKPLMDNVYLDIHFFNIPMRLLWNNYARFFGAQTNPGDSTDYLIPVVSAFTATPGS